MDATDKSAGPGQRVRLSLRWKAFGTLTVLLGVIHACFGAFEYHQSVQITRHDESVRLNGLLQAFDGVREQSAQDLGRIAAQVAASIGTAEMARRPGTHAQVAMELLAEVSGMRIYDVDGTPLGDMMSSPRGVQIPPAVESLLLGSARRTHRPSSTLWCGGDCLQVVYTPAFDRDGREVLVGLSQPVDSLLLAFARQTGADVALLSPSATPNGRLFGHHAYAVTNAPSLLPRLARVTGGRELPPEGRSAILSTAGQSFMTLAAQLPAARGRVLGLFVLDESPALERIGASLATSIAASLCGLLLSAAAIWWLLTPLSRRLQAITRALPMLAEQRFEDARHALRRKEREPRWPDELDLLTSSTEWLSGRLEQLRDAEAASAAKSRFLATMSHEVRTPLNGVLGLLEMLQHSNLDPGQRDSVRMVHESAQSLLRVLDDTLDLARIEAGRIELQREPFSVEDVLSGCVETVAAAARAKGLKLLVHLDSSLPEVVLGDAMRLRQVIGNLCSNAVKFTSSGRVVVSAQNRGRIGNSVHLRFSVYDSGPGIPLDVQRSLFQPFEQGHASTAARFGGTGLGLSICHGLVKRMGGRIGFVSKPEYGTEFSGAGRRAQAAGQAATRHRGRR